MYLYFIGCHMAGLADLIPSPGSETFYTDEFRNELEYHLSYIIERSRNTVKQLTDNEALIYEGDFFGLCCYLGIPHQYIWIALRVNGYRKYEDFTRFDKEIIIPETTYIIELEEAFTTTHRTV